MWQPFTGIGQLVIINRQADVSIGELEPVRPVIMEETHINIVLSNEERRGELCIFVDDSESDRALCVYPEQNEAHVNVRVLKADGTKGERLAARTRKEILRAFAFIAGGASSAAEISLLGKVSKPSDLDLLRERIPNEVEMRFPSYLKKIGITPYRCVTYSLACEEGWALAPTNKHQKAIWDKVHAVPATPMKIEFDPKKGR